MNEDVDIYSFHANYEPFLKAVARSITEQGVALEGVELEEGARPEFFRLRAISGRRECGRKFWVGLSVFASAVQNMDIDEAKRIGRRVCHLFDAEERDYLRANREGPLDEPV